MAEKRAAAPLPVPEPGDPDRKRALNVLAQRRYRQRKRERIRALEKQVVSKHAGEPAAPLSLPGPPPPLVTAQASSMEPHLGMPVWGSAFLDQPVAAVTTSSAAPVIFDFDLFLNQDALLGSPSSAETSSSGIPSSVEAELQQLETSQFTFSDENVLDVPELQVLKAGLNIAEMMGCVESMWDMTALRTFTMQSIPATTRYVPPNLEPTEAQRRLPHHPLFDIIPWPSVRTKLVIVFAQPAQFRPPAARDDMALMQLFYDMDDSAEGVRVYGADYHDGRNWEIGQALFRNWWWIFDREIIENSNALRRRRGAGKLILPP